MLNGILLFVVQLVIVGPMTSQIEARLKQAQVPVALVSSLNSCVNATLPGLAKRIASQPSQGISLAAEIWLQESGIEGVVLKVAPDCAPLMQAVEPFFKAGTKT